MNIHTVRSGETVYSIAKQYGVTPDSIILNNRLHTPDRLVVGESLVIGIPKTEHTARSGETLLQIARQYRVPLMRLYRNNPQLVDNDEVNEGDVLVIEYDQTKKPCIAVNGFVYPNVRQEILQMWLPSVGYITPFSYGFKSDGGIVPMNDAHLIKEAAASGVDPLFMLSTLNSEGSFDNSLSHLLLQDTEMQDYLLSQILSQMEVNQSRILAIDFQFLFSEDKAAYPAFIRRAKERLSPYGYEVWVTLAPQSEETEGGALFEGLDQEALGKVADRLLLNTYEWGYRYGDSTAVAPIGELRKAVDFTLRYAPSEKILLGVPNYGYDFTVSDDSSASSVETLSGKEAVTRAALQNAKIEFDGDTGAPYYHYYKNGTRHEVYYEDARSIQAKLDLVEEKGLYGISIWNLETEFPEALMLLTPYCIE